MSEDSKAHLFVLVHGLWGGPNHLQTVEKCLRTLIEDPDRKIVTLKVASFRFWKTYDGVKMNAARAVEEMLYEIEVLRKKNKLIVDRISFVGYSLGGLVARYMIGMLHEMDFFTTVLPVFFSTFATPHVGIEFFRKGVLEFLANNLGRHLFGPSGRDLFMSSRLLVEMADPELAYFQGLAMFEKHVLLANVRNDRSVAFFTSFIADYAPFDDWKRIKIGYLEDLPEAHINSARIRPKFVDLAACHKLSEDELASFAGNVQEEPSVWTGSWYRRLSFLLFAVCFVPIWIPISFTVTSIMSIYSTIKVRLIKVPDVAKHWTRVRESVYGKLPMDLDDVQIGQDQRDRVRHLSRHSSFKGDTSRMTENLFENVMMAEDRFRNEHVYHEEAEEEQEEEDAAEEDSNSSTGLFKKRTVLYFDKEANDKTARKYVDSLRHKDLSQYPLFTEETKLKVSAEKRFIIDNLNKIDWVKIPVYIDCLNAHDAVVSRRGPTWHIRGTSTIGLWCSILRIYYPERSDPERGDPERSDPERSEGSKADTRISIETEE